jgi:hypothetical protein
MACTLRSPRTSSWVIFGRPYARCGETGLIVWLTLTHHCAVGYFRPSLRDLNRLALFIRRLTCPCKSLARDDKFVCEPQQRFFIHLGGPHGR